MKIKINNSVGNTIKPTLLGGGGGGGLFSILSFIGRKNNNNNNKNKQTKIRITSDVLQHIMASELV